MTSIPIIPVDLDLDKELYEKVDLLWRLRDQPTRDSFRHFHTSSDNINPSFCLMLFLTFYSISLLGTHLDETHIAHLAVLVGVLVLVWGLYVESKLKKRIFQLSRHKSIVYIGVFLLLNSLACARLIAQTLHHCKAGNCEDTRSIPMDSLILVLLIPMVFPYTTGGSHMLCTLVLWVEAIAALVLLCCYHSSSVLPLVAYGCGSVCVVLDSQKFNYFVFFSHRKLLEILKKREMAANEENAEEMRHMIANVAHDLKTVSAPCCLVCAVLGGWVGVCVCPWIWACCGDCGGELPRPSALLNHPFSSLPSPPIYNAIAVSCVGPHSTQVVLCWMCPVWCPDIIAGHHMMPIMSTDLCVVMVRSML